MRLLHDAKAHQVELDATLGIVSLEAEGPKGLKDRNLIYR